MPSLDPLPPSAEAIARKHHRMQRGLALSDETERRAERVASQETFAKIEQSERWQTVFAILLTVTVSLGTLGIYLFNFGPPAPPRASLARVPSAQFSTGEFTPPPVSSRPAAPAAMSATYLQPRTMPSAASHVVTRGAPQASFPPAAPAVALSPAPDYAARDRRVESLKQEMNSLDDFIRQIRNNPYASHRAEPGHYHYEYWQYTRGNWLIQEHFEPYMKWLDARRDDLRREKWRLEGR